MTFYGNKSSSNSYDLGKCNDVAYFSFAYYFNTDKENVVIHVHKLLKTSVSENHFHSYFSHALMLCGN